MRSCVFMCVRGEFGQTQINEVTIHYISNEGLFQYLQGNLQDMPVPVCPYELNRLIA